MPPISRRDFSYNNPPAVNVNELVTKIISKVNALKQGVPFDDMVKGLQEIKETLATLEHHLVKPKAKSLVFDALHLCIDRLKEVPNVTYATETYWKAGVVMMMKKIPPLLLKALQEEKV